jgi:hypothetical protein
MEPAQLARIHLECALRLTNRDFLVAWIQSTTNTTATSTNTPTPPSGRGRRPGAADDATRCTWKRTGGTSCKNARTNTSLFCRIHVPKAHLLAITETNRSTNVETETGTTTATLATTSTSMLSPPTTTLPSATIGPPSATTSL